jgi:hypothetical protein
MPDQVGPAQGRCMRRPLPSVTCRQYGWLTVTTTSRSRATPARRAIVDEYLAWMEPSSTDAGMGPRFEEFVVASRLGRPIAVAGVRRGADDSPQIAPIYVRPIAQSVDLSRALTECATAARRGAA